MATVKPHLDTRYKSKDGTYPVVVRVRHQQQLRDIPSGYKIQEQYWGQAEVKKQHPQALIINSKLASLLATAKEYFADCDRQKRPIRLDLIGSERNSYSFNDYLLHRAVQFEGKKMVVMARKTRRLDKELRLFHNKNLSILDLEDDERNKRPLRGVHIYFDEINQDMLRNYEAWLVDQGNVNNTRHKKFKFLQEFYGQAVEDGKAQDPNPFKKYKILKKPVKKSWLTKEELAAYEQAKFAPGPVNDARNLALFSYYCKGARFENCITCQRSQIVNDRLVFRANKGNKFITIKIHSRLQMIIDQYNGNFIFPYLTELPADKEKFLSKIDSLNVIVNRNLKAGLALVGIEKNITFKNFRDTFAYHLKQITGSIHVIKDSLGHSDTRTTEMYLKALDDEYLDKDMLKLYGE